MEKIEIKLKECCLSCEHFDSSGIQGFLSFPSLSCCREPERVIACGHMEVCYKYMGLKSQDTDQIVRCKDCQFWKTKEDMFVDIGGESHKIGECSLLPHIRYEEEHFCSNGRLKANQKKEETTHD